MKPIPYSRQEIDESDIAAVCSVLRSDFLTQGPQIERFEQDFAARHQVRHAVAVSNATAGLHIACLALGVGPGSLVWTSPNSFVASANCALYCGAEVDFVDIDPHTRNMCPQQLADKLQSAQARGRLPDVVIPVHFAGFTCDMAALRDLADRSGFKLIEDASHAAGASINGTPVGSRFADASVFSFHAVKVVTSAEGGMVTTQDDTTAQCLKLLRSHGITRDAHLLSAAPEGPWIYEQLELGFNYRLTDLQAALGASQLERMDAWQRRRESLADSYDELLAGLPLTCPTRVAGVRSSWHLYAIELQGTVSRAAVFGAMRAAGIGVNVHYIPIHIQPYYARLGFRRGDFPAAEGYYERALSLPLFPAMTTEQQRYVVQTLKEALSSHSA
jgi:UDP-4-amino-4,6-dideoxy-N-acetyl-beta-L-altrosamine transaminase